MCAGLVQAPIYAAVGLTAVKPAMVVNVAP